VGGPGDDPDERRIDDIDAATDDAAAIVRAAFAQAERLNRQAEEAKATAERLLAEARVEADRILASVQAERDHLLESARRDRVAAEEALLRAKADADREASGVLARASELARREAEVLLEGARMELLKARDEATQIRAQAERDAEAILAAATARARSTSADILAATRRRIGDALGPAATAPAPRPDLREQEGEAVDLTDDRPPPDPQARYRMNWVRSPREDDIDAWMAGGVQRAVGQTLGGVFRGSHGRRRPRRSTHTSYD
jgi:F0F1-type ATP synthase membrane subunit b/b'